MQEDGGTEVWVAHTFEEAESLVRDERATHLVVCSSRTSIDDLSRGLAHDTRTVILAVPPETGLIPIALGWTGSYPTIQSLHLIGREALRALVGQPDTSEYPRPIELAGALFSGLTALAIVDADVGAGGFAPSAIGRGFPRLTRLSLVGNWINSTYVSELASGLPNLVFLDLSRNQIDRAGAEAIARHLPLLNHLVLTDNQVDTAGVTAIANQLANLTTLRLTGNHIGESGVAAIARNLVQLTTLDLWNSQIGDTGATAIAERLFHLTTLHLGSNQISDAGATAIAYNLPRLSTLDLWNNQIGPAGALAIAKNLPGLTTLDLWTNQVGPVGAQSIAEHLHGLTTLRLSENRIGPGGATAIAQDLPNLTTLALWNSGILTTGATVIAERLHQLTSLNLGSNHLGSSAATTIAANLTRLTSLNLARNDIGTLGAAAIASRLSELRTLDLSNNNIRTGGALAIANYLTGLTTLNLNGNKVGNRAAAAIASNLPALTSLHLRENKVDNVGLRDLAKALVNTDGTAIRVLDVRGNPLVAEVGIPELLESTDAQALLAAFRRLFEAEEAGGIPFGEAKLVLLGDEFVGKTSLVKALIDHEACNPDEPKTPGVRHEIWTPAWPLTNDASAGAVRLNVWDFGGQEMLHQTHRYFLTERCIHLIVLSKRKEDDRSVYSWLRTVRARAPESPVIVVINKCDDGQHNLDVDFDQLRREHPDIVEVVSVSCTLDPSLPAGADGPHHSLVPLRQLIERLVREDPRLDSVRRSVPAAWVRVRREIRQLAADQQVLDADRYITICASADEADLRVTDQNEQRALLRLLHQTGVVVAHGLTDETRSLHGLTLLDPNWLTEAIYALLADNAVRERDGVFDREVLRSSLAARGLAPDLYPTHRLDYVIDMMCLPEFGLAFAIDTQSQPATYLLPEALTSTAPASINGWDPTSLRLRYRYTDLPRGLVPQFEVLAHEHFGDQPARWRSGCTLEIHGCPVLIDGHLGDDRIEIQVAGPAGNRRDAMAVVRSLFDRVHSRMPETRPEERVPLPHEDSVDVAYSHLLKLAATYGPDHAFLPEGADSEHRVSDLLDGIQAPVPGRAAPTEPLQPSITINNVNQLTDARPSAAPAPRKPTSTHLSESATIGSPAGALAGLAALQLSGDPWTIAAIGAHGGAGAIAGGVLGLIIGWLRAQP